MPVMGEEAKPKKSIQEALREQEQVMTKSIMAHVPVEEYHKIIEEVNLFIDLNMHAQDLVFQVHLDAIQNDPENSK